jgi:protein disulfide-isomerase
MYARCPETLERERSLLYMTWLGEKLAPAADGAAAVEPLTAEQKAEALDWLGRILDDPALARENVFAVNFLADDLVASLTEPDSEARHSLVARFHTAWDRLFADERLYKRERIYTLRGRIDLERIDDPEAPLSDALAARIRDAAVWADESTPDPWERQPIINAMANVLAAAGMNDLRREMLLAELEVSKQPYYFMTGLAGVEQAEGNTGAALEWLRKGWETSTGPATRFQWGYYYLDGLLEMAPGEAATIRDTTVALIDGLRAGAGFYQRPKGQLARLETALIAWGEENGRADTLTEIRAAVLEVCRAEEAEESRRVCEGFLDSL